jgi:ribonuclease Y
MLEMIVAVAALLAGAACGFWWHSRRVQRVLGAAQQQRDGLLQEARRAADLRKRETAARSLEDALELQRGAETEQAAYREEFRLVLERVRKGEARIARVQRTCDERQAEIDARLEAASRRQGEVRQIRAQAKEIRRAQRAKLEERAGQKRDEIAAQLAGAVVAETRSNCEDYLRNLESSEGLELDRRAKRIMGIAMQRYCGHYPRERGGAVVQLEPKQLERLRRDGAVGLDELRAFAGVDITVNEEDASIRIDTGDGVARELCRRAIARLLRQEPVKDVEELFRRLQDDIAREIKRFGRKAFEELELDVAPDEISDLVGRLNWRTSYTQNQYKHSIEAARLAGLMAEELGLRRDLASRGTLLHDIGKALTHSVEGSHALLGAEIARRNGELELVANAIGAHHGEEPMGTPYAWLATAADAMSGGRPGARREISDAYADRIGDLEKIASSFRGVQSVHAAQAGRELRIFVDEKRVGEQVLGDLSDEIAQRISDEMTFPGQIRVTVIREFRAVSEAC